MANNSTPRINVATVRSAVNAHFTIREGERPTEPQIQEAITRTQRPLRRNGKLIAGTPGIGSDGRFYAAWSPMPNSKRRSFADQAAAAQRKAR